MWLRKISLACKNKKEEFLSCISYFQREMPEGTFSQYAGLFSCLLLVCLPKINGFVSQYSHLVDCEGLKSVQDKPWGHWKLKSPWKGYRTLGDHHKKQAKSSQAALNPKWLCQATSKPVVLLQAWHLCFIVLSMVTSAQSQSVCP